MKCKTFMCGFGPGGLGSEDVVMWGPPPVEIGGVTLTRETHSLVVARERGGGSVAFNVSDLPEIIEWLRKQAAAKPQGML